MLQVLMITNKKLTKKQLNELTGGLSEPSKMPCHSFSIPAKKCITGRKLRDVKGSICESCYALKGRYVFNNVQEALDRRYDALMNPLWIDAMVETLTRFERSAHFRWHDSGDLQSIDHLKQIVAVCNGTPHLSHWLPTREYSIVSQYLEQGNQLPENLTIRLSAFMFNGNTPDSIAKRLGVQVSGATESGFTCPSASQGNKCLECRACWNKSIFSITYKKH